MSSGYPEYETLIENLGKYKKGKGCHYINKLADVDISVLKTMLEKSW